MTYKYVTGISSAATKMIHDCRITCYRCGIPCPQLVLAFGITAAQNMRVWRSVTYALPLLVAFKRSMTIMCLEPVAIPAVASVEVSTVLKCTTLQPLMHFSLSSWFGNWVLLLALPCEAAGVADGLHVFASVWKLIGLIEKGVKYGRGHAKS